MISNLPGLKESNGDAKYRQITTHLRNLIKTGKLKPGARLPPARELAKTWQTNAFTIHRALAPLVTEGLIERVRRRGTFVRDHSRQIASIALYCGGNLWRVENAFYQCLYEKLGELCHERKVRSTLFIDSRDDRDKSVAFPALLKAVDSGEVQGIVASMMGPHEGWLKGLHLPLSALSTWGIQPSQIEFLELVISRFTVDGCKTVGVVTPRMNQDWYVMFKSVATRHGLKVDPGWPSGGGLRSDPSFEFAGYRQFKERWSSHSRPDGILVYPDVVCKGVTIAALELGVRVPQDVHLIYHRNTGIDYLCPWKLPSLIVDVEEVARVLLDYVDAQYRHEVVPMPVISSKLMEV